MMKKIISDKHNEEMRNCVDVLNIIRFMGFFMVFLLHSTKFAYDGWYENVSFAWILYTPAWAGVWIFFVLSGYGIGSGFVKQRFKIESIKDLLNYWKTRVLKLIGPYYLFLIIVTITNNAVILMPSKENLWKIIKLMIFIYSSEEKPYALAWYLCTLLALYLIAPLIYIICSKLARNTIQTSIAIFGVIGLGFVLRIGMRIFLMKTSLGNWSDNVYVPFYMNLDMFISGFLINYIRPYKAKRWLKISAVLLIIGFVMLNSWMYFQADIMHIHNSGSIKDNYITVYQYFFPTIYIILTGMVIYFCDVCRGYKILPYSRDAIKKNPFRIIDGFTVIMMYCYLFHVIFISAISPVITAEYVANLQRKIPIIFGEIPTLFLQRIIALTISFILLSVFSTILSSTANKKRK